jgi:3-oxoadipate enol-lactonase
LPYTTNGNVKIYYETAGEGPAMVMLHANPVDHSSFLYQIAHFSTWYRTIAVDLRGYGRTDAVTEPFRLADLCQDVVAVCRAEAVTEAIFMGVSIGSKMSIMLALDRPDLVKAVIAVGGASGPVPTSNQNAEHYRNLGAVDYLPKSLSGVVSPAYRESPLGRHLLGTVIERSQALGWKGDAIARTYETVPPDDLRPRLQGLALPVLVVNGALDIGRPRGEETASLIPGARHALMPDRGHLCTLEDPQGFDEIVLAFLRDNDLLPRE